MPGWKGLIRKGETLLIVLVACRLDVVMATSFVRDAVVIGFICNETISIIENAGLDGPADSGGADKGRGHFKAALGRAERNLNMNAHITKNNNISAGTVARTAVLGLALANQILSACGKPLLPIDSAQLEQWVTAGLTSAAAIWAWWENNSFTKEALAADSYLEQLKKGVH